MKGVLVRKLKMILRAMPHFDADPPRALGENNQRIRTYRQYRGREQVDDERVFDEATVFSIISRAKNTRKSNERQIGEHEYRASRPAQIEHAFLRQPDACFEWVADCHRFVPSRSNDTFNGACVVQRVHLHAHQGDRPHGTGNAGIHQDVDGIAEGGR